jgi:hypothetical protein
MMPIVHKMGMPNTKPRISRMMPKMIMAGPFLTGTAGGSTAVDWHGPAAGLRSFDDPFWIYTE